MCVPPEAARSVEEDDLPRIEEDRSSVKAKLSLGQREVKIQEGPLYRAEGYPVSISCNVSGHQGPSKQDFQWSIYPPAASTREVQIISTKDASFSYAVYAQRVKSKEIYVERLRGNSVLLHITKLQMKDAGEYECHTPNTDGKYFGSYSAKTNLTVIPDTLSATMPSQTLRKKEGEPLELTCEATKATAQHTHLALSWYLMREGESQAIEIISLSRDFLLAPGPSYAARFAAGDVRLDKLGATSFKLSVGRLQPSDQGQLFCEATEWIQDPDETWTLITRKQTDQTALRIQPAARDFEVNITARSLPAEGKPLELTCLVVGRGSDLQFQGFWFLNGKEIAQIDAGGVLILKTDYRDRASQGQLQVSKLHPQAFSLKIFSVGPEEVGTYSCEVAEVLRTQTNSWQVLQRKQSSVTQVQLREPAARNVTVSAEQRDVWEGEELTLLCKAGGDAGPLSVSWWLIPQAQTTPVFVAGMEQDGTVQLGVSSPGPRSHSNKRLEKVDWATFRLEIGSAMVTDSGTYECRVSERLQNQAEELQWTQKIAITVKSLKSSLQVHLLSRQPHVTLSHTLDLSCIVRANHSDLKLPCSVTWQFQPAGSRAFHPLVRITHNGTVEWGDDLSQFHRKTKVSQSSLRSQLQIHDAALEETGVYRCTVEGYDRNSLYTSDPARVSATSNPVKITVTFPGSQIRVSKVHWLENATEHDEVGLSCSLDSPGSPASLYSVTWYWSREKAVNQMLAHLQYDGLLEYSREGRRRALHCYRSSPTDFVLKLHRVELEDAGMYWCRVSEWQQRGPPGKWINQASDESQRMMLRVLPSESTLSSRICSSEAFLHFLIVCPFLMLMLLFTSLLCLCWKARKLSQLSLSAQKEKALWVDMKRGASGDWTTGRKTEDAEPQGEPMLMEGM
ncbi:Immunoglobulin superfamily member 2 [Microtus ochrogaster]|nr:Immunoglobulin superfamily member 2 [Microtus ochrogaster]